MPSFSEKVQLNKHKSLFLRNWGHSNVNYVCQASFAIKRLDGHASFILKGYEVHKVHEKKKSSKFNICYETLWFHGLIWTFVSIIRNSSISFTQFLCQAQEKNCLLFLLQANLLCFVSLPHIVLRWNCRFSCNQLTFD